MFGRGHLEGFAGIYRERLRPQLADWPRKYWDRHLDFFGGKRSFYFRGSAGLLARFMNFYIDKQIRLRSEVDALLAAPTLDEQKRIYRESLHDAYWTGFMRRFVRSGVALSMMGVPREQRLQVENHFGLDISKFIEKCIEEVFSEVPIQDNYFWRLYLHGEYTPECCPEYLKPANFVRLKGGLADRISTHTTTVEAFLREGDAPVTRFVLLDHMDWLSTFGLPALQSEWQAIVDRAADGARILFRSGGLEVHYVDPLRVEIAGRKHTLGEMLEYDRELATQLHAQDRVHTYGSFHIAELHKT